MLIDTLVPNLKKPNLDPFSPLIGQTANGCRLGYGSTLFLEFGKRTASRDPKPHSSGEWSLQFGSVLWRIVQETRVLAGSEDDMQQMKDAVNELNGRVLVHCELCELTGDSAFKFSDDLLLRTFVLTSEEDARWSLRRGEEEWLIIGPSLTKSQEQSGGTTNG